MEKLILCSTPTIIDTIQFDINYLLYLLRAQTHRVSSHCQDLQSAICNQVVHIFCNWKET